MKNLNLAFLYPHLNDEMGKDEKDEDPIDVRTLYAAVLARAICDAFSTTYVAHEIRREANAWLLFWEEKDRLEEFTFPWVCEHLDLDPINLRKTLAKNGVLKDYRFHGHFDLNGFIRRYLAADEVQIRPCRKYARSEH